MPQKRWHLRRRFLPLAKRLNRQLEAKGFLEKF